MVKNLVIALEEELEINKLKEAQKQANKFGDAAVLYDNLKTEKKIEEDKAEEGVETTDSSSEPETSTEVEGEETTDQEPEENVAAEELRSLTYSQEGFVTAATSVVALGTTAVSHIGSALSYIGELGVTYGPGIINRIYKGVVYVFGKLAKLSIYSLGQLDKYIRRRINSFENIQKDIEKLKESLALVKEKDKQNDLKDTKFVNERVINTLKISDNVNFTENLKTLEEFVSKGINQLSANINNDVHSVKHLLSYAVTGNIKNAVSLLQVKPLNIGLEQGLPSGFSLGNEHTDSYQYPKRLPSDIAFMISIPKSELTDLEQITNAYNGSSVILGIDMESFKAVESVNYMTSDELSSFLDSLGKLCDVCVQHQKLYEIIQRSKGHLKYSFRNYFANLVNSNERVSMKDSLIEHIYLKNMFIDKVYLVAMMDIHDYSTKVMSSALSYAHENIKKLS